MQPLYETTLAVSTYECDLNRRWKPAAFFQHLTETAGVHADVLGFGFDAMQARNLFWVHSRMKIQFFRFPTAGELITIRTWPKTIQQKLFYIRDFEVLDRGGERVAAASSAWLVMDADARKLVTPQSLQLNLPTNPDRVGIDEPLDRLGVGTTGEERLVVEARYSAIDLLGHVNNSRYVEWICDAFPLEIHQQQRLEWIQVNYDREVRPGEALALRSYPAEDRPGLWMLEGFNCTTETRAFEAALQWRDA